MACVVPGCRWLRRVAMMTTAITTGLAGPEQISAQQPWANARCYELTHGHWRVEGDTARSRLGPPPAVPELLILEDALAESFYTFGQRDPGDTALHVVHGRTRDGKWSAGFDPSFVWWRQPERDRLIVWFGTGSAGFDYAFKIDDDRLRGDVGTHDHRASYPSWRAPVTGRPVRCPPAPAAIGRLRLSIADGAASGGPRGSERLVLATEKEFDCGGRTINYAGLVSPDTIGVVVLGTFHLRGQPCLAGRGPATTEIDLPRTSRRVVYLIKHEGHMNRFVLRRTGSSLSLKAEQATTVVVADGAGLRRLAPPR